MPRRLKPIAAQRIVITGATSGIGFAIARHATAHGARCLLVARYADGLQALVDDIESHDGRAAWAVADAQDVAALRAVTDMALRLFGGFDSWINNASVAAFGTSGSAVYQRVFELGFSSVVNGSLEAADHLHARRDGDAGAIINLGAPRSVPATASNAGCRASERDPVSAFTDSFRDELDAVHSPISVSLIRPAAIASGSPGGHTPPRYDPAAVARGVLHCAAHPTRELDVDSSVPVGTLATRITARLSERLKGCTGSGAPPVDSR